MNNNTEPRDILAHTGRMRALAQRLLRDAAAADDVVQGALCLAIEKGGAPEGHEGPWLMTVVRNLVTDRRRQVARAHDRERQVARPEATLETAEAAVMAERQRDVANAVLGLDEPYRSVLLLRFFEELPPRAIAKRLGRTSATVQQQVRRGLEHLRGELEARYGDRGSWAVALLPLAGRGTLRLGAAAAGGGGALGIAGLTWTKILVPVLLLLAALGAHRWMNMPPEPAGMSPAGPADTKIAGRAAQPLTETGSPGVDPASQVGPRTALGPAGQPLSVAPKGSDKSQPSAAMAARSLEARLVDLNGAPLTGVEVQWTGERTPRSLRSDAGGWIRSDAIAAAPTPDDVLYDLRCPADRWQILDGGLGPDGELVVAIAPCVRMAGRVLEKDGTPVPGATVRIDGRLDGLASFDLPLSETSYSNGSESTTADSAGAFDLGWAPAHATFRIHVARKNTGRSQPFEVPLEDTLALQLELNPVVKRTPAPVEPSSVYGRVVRPDGSPVPSAFVNLGGPGSLRVRTDADGAFRFDRWHGDGTLVAKAPDGRFAAKTNLSREAAFSPAGSGPHLLTIPDQMSTLAVQVTGPGGRPVQGLLVVPLDGTNFGGERGFLEQASRRAANESWVRTDAKGVALLTQMLDREYRLRIVDEKTMLTLDTAPLATGQGLQRISLPEDPLAESLTGVILDYYGAPIPNAPVQLMVTTWKSKRASRQLVGQSVLTGPEGRFEMRNVPWKGFTLSASSPTDEYTRAKVEVHERLTGEPFQFVLDRTCELVFELVGEPQVDQIRAVRADGEPVSATWIGAFATGGGRAIPRAEDGSFPVAHLPQSVTEIVLLSKNQEVRRVPVQLKPTGRAVIRL